MIQFMFTTHVAQNGWDNVGGITLLLPNGQFTNKDRAVIQLLAAQYYAHIRSKF